MERVVSGQHGWLFYAEQQMIEHYLGAAKFTPKQLQSWRQLLQKRHDWLAARGIQYLFVIAPDKQDIYPEELPVWLQKAVPPNRETKLDQLEKYLRAHSTVPVLDLRQALIAAKATRPDYLLNDSHWNTFGAFAACQELINHLSKDFPNLPPLRLEDFTWTNTPAAGGDLVQMLGATSAEKNAGTLLPRPGVTMPSSRPVTNLVLRWQTRYPDFLSENPAPRTETAVVFHDSFGKAWVPSLACSFKRVLFVWDNREFNSDIVAANHPRVVINEMLERYVDTEDPDEMLAKDALP